LSTPKSSPPTTRYREIYDRIRATIIDGNLRPGDRLPSTRTLAAELKVARGTVDAAYSLLSGEGFLVVRDRVGTVVSSEIPAHKPAIRSLCQARPIESDPQDITHMFAAPLPLMPGLPSFDLFPRTQWSQLVGRHGRRAGTPELSYPDPLGNHALRESVAAHLAVARGIRCDPAQIIVTGGYLAALGLLCRALLQSADQAWIEDPGYPFTAHAVRAVGGQIAPIPVDSEGLDVEAGLALAPKAALCVVTPSCQFPLGTAMSLRRRLALLDWAGRAGSYVVEDDYAGEFRYEGSPIPALKSLDQDDRVFYIGTFSKTLFPGLRLGYLVVPRDHLAQLRTLVRHLDGGRPALEQAIVADFLASGRFARHIKRMRRAYASRRSALIEAFRETFGNRFPLLGTPGGLHLVATAEEDDRVLEARAVEAGLRPLRLSRMSFQTAELQGLMLGFANLPEAQAMATVKRLASALSSAPALFRRQSSMPATAMA
jgi:GntR family transcriptional regulator / MocR family aminotransferase